MLRITDVSVADSARCAAIGLSCLRALNSIGGACSIGAASMYDGLAPANKLCLLLKHSLRA
jgi:hypothetical protein